MTHTERRVRLFRFGRNQTLRIPREFEFEGVELTVTPAPRLWHNAKPMAILPTPNNDDKTLP